MALLYNKFLFQILGKLKKIHEIYIQYTIHTHGTEEKLMIYHAFNSIHAYVVGVCSEHVCKL